MDTFNKGKTLRCNLMLDKVTLDLSKGRFLRASSEQLQRSLFCLRTFMNCDIMGSVSVFLLKLSGNGLC